MLYIYLYDAVKLLPFMNLKEKNIYSISKTQAAFPPFWQPVRKFKYIGNYQSCQIYHLSPEVMSISLWLLLSIIVRPYKFPTKWYCYFRRKYTYLMKNIHFSYWIVYGVKAVKLVWYNSAPFNRRQTSSLHIFSQWVDKNFIYN